MKFHLKSRVHAVYASMTRDVLGDKEAAALLKQAHVRVEYELCVESLAASFGLTVRPAVHGMIGCYAEHKLVAWHATHEEIEVWLSHDPSSRLSVEAIDIAQLHGMDIIPSGSGILLCQHGEVIEQFETVEAFESWIGDY